MVPGDRLPGYLGPDATLLQRYEVVDLTAGKYVSIAGQGFANVDIFRFPDFVKAFGAYSMHKSPNMQFLGIANESFHNKYSIHLWRGPFYVRVIGSAQGGVEQLKALVAYLAERMPAAPSAPAVLNFFPVDTRVPGSEAYAIASGFDLPFLGNSFQAKFNVGEVPVDGIVIPAANPQAAAKILDSYRNLYLRNGKLLDPIPKLGEDNFTAEDRYLGRAVAFRLDRFVVAFNGYVDRQRLIDLAIATDARILGSIRRQLVTADKEAAAAARAAVRGTPANTSTVPPWQQQTPR